MLTSLKFGTYIFFGVLTLMGAGFIYFFVPETKGLPVEEIVRIFEQNPSSPGTAPARAPAR